MRSLHLFTLFLLFPIIVQGQLTIEEHYEMENLNNPRISGTDIIYSKTSKEKWDGRSFSSIVITDLRGKEHKLLTQSEYDYNPKWSPDGKWISFISYRNNLQQIYIIPKSGGEPKMVSDAENNFSIYKWVDNNTIAYFEIEPRDSSLVAMEKENGWGYFAGTEFGTNALWIFDINTRQKEKITEGKYLVKDFDFSKDGKYLAILGAKNDDNYEYMTNSWIKVMDRENNVVYTFDKANALNNPKFSPSGKKLVFAGSTEGFASNDGLFVADLTTGETKNLTWELDPTIENIQWIDENNISFSTPEGVYTGIYQINTKGKINTLVKPYWVIYNYQFTRKEIFFTAARGSKTIQLYRLKPGDSPEKAVPLTQINQHLISKIKTTSTAFKYESKDGTEVEGVLTFPPHYDKTKPYPLMTIVHGGPDLLIMDDFNLEPQFFADQGYIVFQPNFRGSTGYGRAFYAGNRGKFGETDFEDIMSGVDKLVALKIADKDKLALGGTSYGGYMANWAITQTDQFKAAIGYGGLSNLVSLYGQHPFSNRELGIWEYKTLPIDNVEIYRKSSPIFFVKNANTPLLILHGERDPRSPVLQAWEMYRAMKDANKEVEMMLYPKLGHNINHPVYYKSILNQWLTWANKHINGQENISENQ
ncbi:S9 family peptidase [Xanthovirga aplysinae]|uniref:S9 family peptidase n=1 Tax=Xanthovirga aplysinae TaxID=2529853 RepID=UPI0012BD80F2|nr:S9 family peptidase [Xanthovirga aplysinae]MTI30589.1 S9 family peptidase [Xanthovirga aplysinae]